MFLEGPDTATGVDPSNIDGNKGIVNNYYEVWEDFTEKITELNLQVYDVVEHFMEVREATKQKL